MGCQQSSVESLIEQLAGDDAYRVYSACDRLWDSLVSSCPRTRRAVEAGAIEAVVGAMRRHATHAPLQRRASEILWWCFLLAEKESGARALEAGALEALQSAQKKPGVEPYYPVCALHLLLVKGSGPKAREHRMRALELGLLQQLQQSLPTFTLDLTREKGQEMVDVLSQVSKQAPEATKGPAKKEASTSRNASGPPAPAPAPTAPLAPTAAKAPSRKEASKSCDASGPPAPAPAPSAPLAPTAAKAPSRKEASPAPLGLDHDNKDDKDVCEFVVVVCDLHEEAEERRKASANGSFADTGSTYASDSTAEESTKSAGVPEGLALPAPSRDRFRWDRSSTPSGIRVCEVLDEIYQHYQTARQANGDESLKACCQEARQPTAAAGLQQSVFGLLTPEEIKGFLLAPDHRMWMDIKHNAERFLRPLDEPGTRVPWKVKDITPESQHELLRTLRPVVMDQTVREPATNTPFGHTGYMKFLTLQIVKRMGFKDVAITGQYYESSYTPETQVLEWMRYKGEPMDGMVAMFGPGERAAGIKAIRDFGIPNAFLDLTFKASIRFADANFVTSVLDAVEELDSIFTQMGLPPNPWRSDEQVNSRPGSGEISLNLVDLMEFLDLQPGETLEQRKPQQLRAEEAFARWKESEAFRRRVVAILTEEGRGCANHKDYGMITRWLRKQFPIEERYRILIHAHAGDGNTQDAASIEAALNGGNGVWSAVIPQAAQGGHNSSLVFLDNMLQMGNENVLRDFWLFQASQCARHIYYLNFNTYDIPGDCPIWGDRVSKLTHTAFCKIKGEVWRQRRGDYYNVWGERELLDLKDVAKNSKHRLEVNELRAKEKQTEGDYRISPLVSDLDTWTMRISETRILGAREIVGEISEEVRTVGFALMNAGLRVNLDSEATLSRLVTIAKRLLKERSRCPNVHGYEKAKQHQGHFE